MKAPRGRATRPEAQEAGLQGIDHGALARELTRVLRGDRSREAFARRLGVSANAIYAWETGRRIPVADLLFRSAERTGVDVLASLRRFLGARALPAGLGPEDPRLCAALLGALKGSERVVEIARRAGVERTALSRWLSGAALPRLPDLLAVVEACGSRLVDFVALFVEPGELPSLGLAWARVRAARRLVGEHPWALAMLVALELELLKQAPEHPPGFIGATVGLDPEAEQRCLSLLQEAGLVSREGERWVPAPIPPVALLSPEAQRAARAWAAREAAGRIAAQEDGTFGFIAFSASHEDYQRLLKLHREYAEAVVAIALHPTGHEAVFVLNAHLFPLARKR